MRDIHVLLLILVLSLVGCGDVNSFRDIGDNLGATLNGDSPEGDLLEGDSDLENEDDNGNSDNEEPENEGENNQNQSEEDGQENQEIGSECQKLKAFLTQHSKAKRVKICHVPPGNPDERHTITVSRQGARNHLCLVHEGETVLDSFGKCP